MVIHVLDHLVNMLCLSINVKPVFDIMRRDACLAVYPIIVYSYGFLFNCMRVCQASDSMTALT